MFEETISAETKRVLEKIGSVEFSRNFYLVGGTGLALQLGHRKSIDLDWFSAKNFSNEILKKEFSILGNFRLVSEEEATIHGILDEVKISFLNYKYGLLFPLIDFEGVKIADERDIAAMKIDAISSRGSKKDFVDMYFLLEKYSLLELIDFFEKKYANIEFNKLHILKSLSYFEDAENEPMPETLRSADWEGIKKKIENEVKKIV